MLAAEQAEQSAASADAADCLRMALSWLLRPMRDGRTCCAPGPGADLSLVLMTPSQQRCKQYRIAAARTAMPPPISRTRPT
jgi:hypothetical protein